MSRRRRRHQHSRQPTTRGLEPLEPRRPLSASALVALSGDWNADGTDSVGYFSPASGEFFVRNDNSAGFADLGLRFGPKNSSLRPIAGDFNADGFDTVGLYDPAGGTFFINNTMSSGAADVTFRFGPKGADLIPLAGNWDGVGGDTVGLYDQTTGKVYLKNTLSPGAADLAFSYGPDNNDWLPVAGDFDGDLIDTLALYNQQAGKFFLKNSNASGPADVVARYGPKNNDWAPLAGDWSDPPLGVDGLALREPTTGVIYQRNDVTSIPGAADQAFYVVASTDDASPSAGAAAAGSVVPAVIPTFPQLTEDDVKKLLELAGQASASDDAIIAVVDRQGQILGVRVEPGVDAGLQADPEKLVFAVDGAVAKARTAAFFANDDAPIISSRTIGFISQTTVTEREVNSNPNTLVDTLRGPGTVARIGKGGHFPPQVRETPPVDLFNIEHTNRDSIIHPGPNLVREGGLGDDILLPNRFNVPGAFIPADHEVAPPESFGFDEPVLLPGVAGQRTQARGIGTLPGGVPIVLREDPNDPNSPAHVVGGIGVFFPGPDGFASFEQGFVPGYVQSEAQRINAPRVLEAEWIAFAATSAISGALPADLQSQFDTAGVDTDRFAFPSADAIGTVRLDLVGIKLETLGPHPDGVTFNVSGLETVLEIGRSLTRVPAVADGSQDLFVNVDAALIPVKYLAGEAVPEGWLVLPHDSPIGDMTAAEVEKLIVDGIAQANETRAAIRLPLGNRTKMVLSVADTAGNVLGLFRMPDATYFSIAVAVAKARNTAYYADATAIQAIDRVDVNPGGPLLDPGVAFTNRTFRFLAEPRFPSGVELSAPGAFSVLNDPGFAIDPRTGVVGVENAGPPAPASSFTSVVGFNSFNPGSNFRDPDDIANQNGIVFFPGSTPLYRDGGLIGGYGISGDGVDQDDVVTFIGAQDFLPPATVTRADQVFVNNVRLPYQKFLRNPEG